MYFEDLITIITLIVKMMLLLFFLKWMMNGTGAGSPEIGSYEPRTWGYVT